MPFRDVPKQVFDLGIQPAAEAANAYALRVDCAPHTAAIDDRVRNEIARCDVMVADVTGQNPNVLYEVGYAHALAKPVIFITQGQFDKLVFDVSRFLHTDYSKDRIVELRDNLVPRIKAALDADRMPRRPVGPCPLTLRLNGIDVPEIGRGKSGLIPLRIPKNSSNDCARAPMALCNTRSPIPFQVEGFHLLAQTCSSVAACEMWPREPDWLHVPSDGYGEFTRRFTLFRGRQSVSYCDTMQLPAQFRVAPPESSSAHVRFELLLGAWLF